MTKQQHIEDCIEIIEELKELINQTNDSERIEDLKRTIARNEQAIEELKRSL